MYVPSNQISGAHKHSHMNAQRANFLRKNPMEQKNPTELENLLGYIQMFTSQQQQQQQSKLYDHCYIASAY